MLRFVHKWFLLVGIAGVSLADGSTTYAAERPNFVLCMADDLGWGDVAYNGNKDVKTPTLDELARTGVRFDRFYAAYNVCSPTCASFMTGRHPVRSGVFSWGWSLRPAEITIAESLKPAGYATGHFGKWHLGTLHGLSATSPGGQGFDEWTSSPNYYDNDPLFSEKGNVVETKGESSDVTVDAAIKFIESSVKKKQPFAAVVWFGNPHVPHKAFDDLKEPYAALTPNLQNYWGEITGIDNAVGKLRRKLRELNVADDTLLLFTSDNGAAKPGSTGGLRGTKGTNYEGGLRVPAVIEWPARFKEPAVVSVPCGTVDILPTVIAAAGTSHPQPGRPLDGQNMLPIIDGEEKDRAQPLGFWTYPNRGKGVNSRDTLISLQKANSEGAASSLPPISPDEEKAFAAQYSTDLFPGHAAWLDGSFKLHRLPKGDGGDEFALYDLAADPNEEHDLAKSQPDRVAKMSKQLETWQRSVLNSLNGGDDARK